MTRRHASRSFESILQNSLRALARMAADPAAYPPAAAMTVEVAFVDQDGGEGTEQFVSREEALAWVKARRCVSASFKDITPNS